MPTNVSTVRYSETKLDKLKQKLDYEERALSHYQLSLDTNQVDIRNKDVVLNKIEKSKVEIADLKNRISLAQKNLDLLLAEHKAQIDFKIEILESKIKIYQRQIDELRRSL